MSVAQQRISSANALLSSPYINGDASRLSSQISAVSSKIGGDYTASSAAEIYAAEAAIRSASDQLASLTSEIAALIAAREAAAQPTPTPTPTPPPAPDPNPDPAPEG